MIEAHLPLVRAIARRYAGRGEDLEDLVQLGAVGLVKASKRFDPNRGVAFGAFAGPAIEGEIRRHLRDSASPLRIPRKLEQMSAELRRSDSKLSASLGRSPSLHELAAALGVEDGDVERALGVEQARDSISISPGVAAVELPADSEALADSDDRLLLARGIRALDKRQRRIVFLRFHADMTERQIARELGISQAHVSRLLASALAKLRRELGQSSEAAGDGDTCEAAGDGDTTVVTPPADDSASPRIPSVGAPQENLTLAQYLELPYHVEVSCEQEGGQSSWKATVEELPGCTSQGGTPEEAVARLRREMESWLTAALAEDRKIPLPGGEAATPRSPRSHSGRFLVRMPKSLHEQLALAAERENVSLNRFVTDALAASVAHSQPAEPSPGSERSAGEIGPVPSGPPARAFRVALATNLVVVVIAGLVALILLVLALQRGI